MVARKMLMLLCMGWISFLCGCASNTIIMTPSVKMAEVPETPTTVYRVVKVTVPNAPRLRSEKFNNPKLSNEFASLAETRYPVLFKNTPEAIPLSINLQIGEQANDGVALLAYLCTCCVLGGVLPSVPWSTDLDIELGVEDRSVIRNITRAQAVHRGWWSLFSPCGLITIPGESDIPAVSTVMTGGPGQVPPQLQDYVMQRMVDLLAKELLSGKPLERPGQSGVLTPQQLPALIPIPSETVNPF